MNADVNHIMIGLSIVKFRLFYIVLFAGFYSFDLSVLCDFIAAVKLASWCFGPSEMFHYFTKLSVLYFTFNVHTSNCCFKFILLSRLFQLVLIQMLVWIIFILLTVWFLELNISSGRLHFLKRDLRKVMMDLKLVTLDGFGNRINTY